MRINEASTTLSVVIAIISLNQHNKKARANNGKVIPSTLAAITNKLRGDTTLSKRTVERVIDRLERHGVLTRSKGSQGKVYQSWHINPKKILNNVWEAEMDRSTEYRQRISLRSSEIIDAEDRINGMNLLDAPTLEVIRDFAKSIFPNQAISDDQLRTIFDGRKLELERQPLLWLRDILCSDEIDVN